MQPFANTESLNAHHVKADKEVCTEFVVNTDIIKTTYKVKAAFRAATINFWLINDGGAIAGDSGILVKNSSTDLMLNINPQFWRMSRVSNVNPDGIGGPLGCTMLCKIVNGAGQRISTLPTRKMVSAGLPINKPILVVTSDIVNDNDNGVYVYSYSLNNRHEPINKIIETCNLYDPTTTGIFTEEFVGIMDFYLSYMYLKELIRIKNGN